MIIKIIAMILHEIVKEYQKLQPEKDHPDESVLSFSSSVVGNERTVDDLDVKVPVTHDGAEAHSDRPLPIGGSGDIGPIIGFNHLDRDDMRFIKEAMSK